MMLPESLRPRVTRTLSRLGSISTTFFGAITLDVATKWLMLNVVMVPPSVIEITPFFNLTLGFNTGVSFGMFQAPFAERPLLLILAQAIIVAGLLVWASRSKSRLDRFCLGLIAGGATGNIIDRLSRGAVTDFLDVHAAGWHWPAFNMADAAITAGVLTLVFGALLRSRPSALGEPRTDNLGTQPVNDRSSTEP